MFGENYSKRCDEVDERDALTDGLRDQEGSGEGILEWGRKYPSTRLRNETENGSSSRLSREKQKSKETPKMRSVRNIVHEHDEAAGFILSKSSHHYSSPKTPFIHLSQPSNLPRKDSSPSPSRGRGEGSPHSPRSTTSQTTLRSKRSMKALEAMEKIDDQEGFNNHESRSASCSSSSTSTDADDVTGDKSTPSHPDSPGLIHRLWYGVNEQNKTDDQYLSRRRPSVCSLIVLIPSLVLVLFLVLFFWVGFSSGTSKAEGRSPRALVFIIEGFSGEVFHDMMVENGGAHLPNIRRLMVNRGGAWAACPVLSDSRCARAVSVEEVVYAPEGLSSTETGLGIDSSSGNAEESVSSLREQQNTFSVYSATSIASILSGVQPRHHKVWNNTIASMKHYAQTSKAFPSLLKVAKDAGMRVTAFGTSHLLNSLGISLSCSEAGVLDMECLILEEENEESGVLPIPGVTPLECLAPSACNANVRRINLPTDIKEMSNIVSDQRYRQVLREMFGGATTQSPLFSSEPTHATARAGNGRRALFSKLERSEVIPSNTSTTAFATSTSSSRSSTTSSLSDLYIFHFDALARRAESSYLPGFSYNVSSAEYRAQVYLIDAMIGETLAYLQDRSEKELENWLVLGISDHGGNDKRVNEALNWNTSTLNGNAKGNTYNDNSNMVNSFDYISPGYDDNRLSGLLRASIVPFFMGTYTSASYEKSYITLKPLESPTSQLDAFPTILRWLNVAPFDDETEAAWVKQLVDGNDALSSKDTFPSSSVEARPQPVSKDAPLADKLRWRAWFEGKVQGICSSGVAPEDCVR